MAENGDKQMDQLLFVQTAGPLAELLVQLILRHVLFVDEQSEIVLRIRDQAAQSELHSRLVAREQIQRTVAARLRDQLRGEFLLLSKSKLTDAQLRGFRCDEALLRLDLNAVDRSD